MKAWISIVLLAVLGLAGLTAASASARQRDVWEYQIAYGDAVGGLNKLGQEGWEAVAVYTPANTNSLHVLMKRRKS